MAIELKNPRFSGVDQDPSSPTFGTHIAGALTGFALYSPSESPLNEGIPVVLPVLTCTLPVSVPAGGTPFDVALPFSCRILFVLGYKVGAGDTGCEIELLNGSDSIGIVDADAPANSFLTMGGRDATYADFAAGDLLTVSPTDAGTGDAAATLYIQLQRL